MATLIWSTLVAMFAQIRSKSLQIQFLISYFITDGPGTKTLNHFRSFENKPRLLPPSCQNIKQTATGVGVNPKEVWESNKNNRFFFKRLESILANSHGSAAKEGAGNIHAEVNWPFWRRLYQPGTELWHWPRESVCQDQPQESGSSFTSYCMPLHWHMKSLKID